MTNATELQLTQLFYPQDFGRLSCKITVFCDFDGPIMDVSERYYSTYKMGLAQTRAVYEAESIMLPIYALTKEEFWQMKRDRIPDAEIAKKSGLVSQQIEVFKQQVTQIVNQPTFLSKDRLQPGVRWALGLLYFHGVRLVLVTLRTQRQATQILEEVGLAKLFSCIKGTDDEQAAYGNYAELKTRLLSEVIAERGMCPTVAWMVGDTEADILAGQALGVPTIALTCGIRSRNYLKHFQPERIEKDLLATAHSLLGHTCLIPA